MTVEKKLGRCTRGGTAFEVVDLPGSYSLTAYSPEEVIARQFLLEERPDVVIVVIDASNLERNLYLAVQLIEMGAPVVLACNAMDLVAARGDVLDVAELARQLDVPAVSTVANRQHGMDELLNVAAQVAEVGWRNREFPLYDVAIEDAIARLACEVRKAGLSDSLYPARWIAIKLLEKDQLVSGMWDCAAVQRAAAAEGRRLAAMFGESTETVLAGQRYSFIASLCASAVTAASVQERSISDRIDAVVMHRVLGIPIFLAAMFAVFWAVFNVGAIPSAWIQNLTRSTADAVGSWWPVESASPLKSLLVNGVIGGVGNVFTFLPNILILFLAIAVLEDSGYMSRVAVIMDRLMHRVGLHGKSFIPLLLGFGCTVPAIMATRTLESRRDRLTSILVAPLMSCGARLPIYSLIIPAFFAAPWQAPMLWAIYLIGIVLAMVMSRVLRSTLFRWRVYAVRDGTARLSDSFRARCDDPHVGTLAALPEEGGHRDSRDFDCTVGAHHLPAAAGRQGQRGSKDQAGVFAGGPRRETAGTGIEADGIRLENRHGADWRLRGEGSVCGADGHHLCGDRRAGRRGSSPAPRPLAPRLSAAGGLRDHALLPHRNAVYDHRGGDSPRDRLMAMAAAAIRRTHACWHMESPLRSFRRAAFLVGGYRRCGKVF